MKLQITTLIYSFEFNHLIYLASAQPSDHKQPPQSIITTATAQQLILESHKKSVIYLNQLLTILHLD